MLLKAQERQWKKRETHEKNDITKRKRRKKVVGVFRWFHLMSSCSVRFSLPSASLPLVSRQTWSSHRSLLFFSFILCFFLFWQMVLWFRLDLHSLCFALPHPLVKYTWKGRRETWQTSCVDTWVHTWYHRRRSLVSLSFILPPSLDPPHVNLCLHLLLSLPLFCWYWFTSDRSQYSG